MYQIECKYTGYGHIAVVRQDNGPSLHTTDFYVYAGDAWRAAMTWLRTLGVDYTKQSQ